MPNSVHSWESLACGYLASYSYKFGFSANQYTFFSGAFDSDEDILKGCKDADFIGFSLTTFQVTHAIHLIKSIKTQNSKAKFIWGGYATNGYTDNQLLELYGDFVDYFVQGPGEEAWVNILLNLNTKKIIRSPMIKNIDNLPFPDRKLIKVHRHFEKLLKLGEGRKTSMEMQRHGCPYKCIFCAAQSYGFNKSIRSADNIIEEMKILRDSYQMNENSMVLMSDSEIMINAEMRKMANLKIKEEINFKYGMNVVASTILNKESRKTLELMVKSGCSEVWMGVESDPSLMHLTGKPNTPNQVKEAFKITKDMGLIRKAYFILGFTPEETKDTIMNRIPFIEDLDPDVVGFTLYIPVPGSSDYKHNIHKNIDYNNSCEYYNNYISTKTLTNKDLHKMQKYLINYFENKNTYRNKGK